MFLNGIEYYSIQYQARGKYELHMAFRVGKSPQVLELVAVDNTDREDTGSSRSLIERVKNMDMDSINEAIESGHKASSILGELIKEFYSGKHDKKTIKEFREMMEQTVHHSRVKDIPNE